MLHIGKLDRHCTDLQMKEHNRAVMNGDPWMAALQERFRVGEKTKTKTKGRHPRYVTDRRNCII